MTATRSASQAARQASEPESSPRSASPTTSKSVVKDTAPAKTTADAEESKPVAPPRVSVVTDQVASDPTALPAAGVSPKMGLLWQEAGLQPLRTKPLTPMSASALASPVDTACFKSESGALDANNEANTTAGAGAESDLPSGDPRALKVNVNVALLPKPNDGLAMPHTGCDSTSPVSPTVMKDLQFDSRFISDAWSYEAPQNMYALLTQPTSQLDPLSGVSSSSSTAGTPSSASSGLVTPMMQLQASQQQQLQFQQQQLEALDAQQAGGLSLPLQMSPIHGSGLSSLYMSSSPLVLSPHQLLLPPQHPSGLTTALPTTPTTVNLADVMVTGDPSLFLAPSSSPTHLLKHLLPPTTPGGSSSASSGVNVKEITLNELRPHFNKPMAVVAKELGVCITLMKKICRRNGLVRWPHRRIRSLVNRITSLQVLAGNASGAERKRFQSQIASLREELSAVIQNPNEKSRKAQADAKARSPMPTTAAKSTTNVDALVEEGDETTIKREKKVVAMGRTRASTVKTELETPSGLVDKTETVTRPKKRKQEFRAGHHAHQPPPIKIPRHDELPSLNRLRSQSVPERRLRGDRRYGRGRASGTGGECERPSSTTNGGRRGSISSILCDIAE